MANEMRIKSIEYFRWCVRKQRIITGFGRTSPDSILFDKDILKIQENQSYRSFQR